MKNMSRQTTNLGRMYRDKDEYTQMYLGLVLYTMK